ncbi:zinc finger MYM-type protein 5 [Suncus etruscus]|uniref:zinc finger MYM-type protein 5 n=1 Tax=Suncus etruscus TaxID=109475 RepID=UPI0021102CC0|nr:zinc finger MYM-type protein 5 [Suncus etruscus]
MDCSVEVLELTEHTPVLLGSTTINVGNSFGDQINPVVSKNSPVDNDEDDDVVFIDSIQPPSTAPAVADPRNFISSKTEKLQGNYSKFLLSSRDLTSQKGNIIETIVIDDEEDLETNGADKKISSSFVGWELPGTKNRIKDLDFCTTSLSRSKSKTGVGPFNPGRMNMTGYEFQNGGFPSHHSPDSWISQSALFPRNQKQARVDSLSPVASLPKQIFQPSDQQQHTKSTKIICAYCKNPLQKGQTAYQRKGSIHLFCSTTCLSSFSHKRTPRKSNLICKNDLSTSKAPMFPPVKPIEFIQKFSSTTCLMPYEDIQNFRKRGLNKSRCTICSKVTEIRHEVSVNNVTHKLCSNQCFNKYRLANGLTMNCCEQCGEYLPDKSVGNIVLIEGQQTRFCCQSCANEYKKIMETNFNKLTASENRKRSVDREENESKLCETLDTCLKKIEEIPQKKEKTVGQKIVAECSSDVSLISQNVHLPSVSSTPDMFQEQLEEKKSEDSSIPVRLSADPGTWPRILNIKQRDSVIENNPPQVRNFNFPKDSTGRKFSETYYTRILPNGEKTTRSWLLYSTSKDSVFCLYCKLLGEGKNQLKNENGCKDWQHLSHILSKHEESEMHINNSVKYSKLKSDLEKKSSEHKIYDNEEKDGVLLLYT